MSGGLLDSLAHILHPHYVSNLLLGSIFFILKSLPPFCLWIFDDCQLELREWELLAFLGCIIVMKNRKASSYGVYVNTACLFAKMLSVYLFLRQSVLYGSLYIIACLLHLAFLPEPVYKGPTFVTFFRGPNLELEIERDKRVAWLIEFYTPWAPTCVSFSPIFAELSAQYNLDNLKFGKLDIGRYAEQAKKFQIDTSAWSKQLPTVVLFQNGKEVRRRPAIDSKGKVRVKFVFSKENIERDFELAALHHDCKQFPLHKHKSSTAAASAVPERRDKPEEQDQSSTLRSRATTANNENGPSATEPADEVSEECSEPTDGNKEKSE